MRRSRRVLAGAAAVVSTVAVLAACTATPSAAPDFQPVPSGGNVEGNNGARVSPVRPAPGTDAGSGPSSSGSSTPRKAVDPLVVATHLRAPVGLSLLPDNTALVGERTTGRIVRVQPRAGRPVTTVRTLHGLDFAGGGGLLDLAVSPHYDEDNLIYAYITTAKDNRVVDFTLHGPVTPVLTGIPKGSSGNAGRIAFGADGDLYIGTGDAGRPALAARPSSLAGKVLRVDDIGQPAAGNPRRSSPVFTTGVRGVDGLCPTRAGMLEVQSATTGRPQVNVLAEGAAKPLATLPARADGPGGCAVSQSRLWVTSLDGQALYSAAPKARGTGFEPFSAVLHGRYGRLRTVVAATDGALWLTTSNRDGHGHPVAADERVIRYVPQSAGGADDTT